MSEKPTVFLGGSSTRPGFSDCTSPSDLPSDLLAPSEFGAFQSPESVAEKMVQPPSTAPTREYLPIAYVDEAAKFTKEQQDYLIKRERAFLNPDDAPAINPLFFEEPDQPMALTEDALPDDQKAILRLGLTETAIERMERREKYGNSYPGQFFDPSTLQVQGDKTVVTPVAIAVDSKAPIYCGDAIVPNVPIPGKMPSHGYAAYIQGKWHEWNADTKRWETIPDEDVPTPLPTSASPAPQKTPCDPENRYYPKFHVYRTDGRDLPGGDRVGREYFTLNPTDDYAARVALRTYLSIVKDAVPGLVYDCVAKWGKDVDPNNEEYAKPVPPETMAHVESIIERTLSISNALLRVSQRLRKAENLHHQLFMIIEDLLTSDMAMREEDEGRISPVLEDARRRLNGCRVDIPAGEGTKPSYVPSDLRDYIAKKGGQTR